MRMTYASALTALVLAAGCTSGQTLEVNDNLSEEEILSKNEHALSSRIKEQFGQNARLTAAVEQGTLTVLHVANEPSPIDSDAVLPVAIAIHDTKADALTVPAATFEYKEARALTGRTALVKASGELELLKADGSKVTLAQSIKGDLQIAGNNGLLATQNHPEDGESNSRVVLISEAGVSKVIADGIGTDDRAVVSPDGKTVLFVSGRTGVASFFVTSLEGGDAVQLTNTELVLSLDGESAPEGFVPVPVNLSRLTWLSPDSVRFDAGANEMWTLNIRTAVATKVGGAL